MYYCRSKVGNTCRSQAVASVRKTASYKQTGAVKTDFCLIPGHGVGARGAVTLRPSNEV